MADLGNRANVNSAIDLLLDDLQPDEAIQPSDHNTLLKDILDTLANGLSTILRTSGQTNGENITINGGSQLLFNNVFDGDLQSDTLSAVRNWILPDASGTIALLSDIPSSDSIYTADGTIGTGRVATLTDTLRFKSGIVEIEGIGTSGSSALAIYDGQGTPVKLWDFLDNGNVSVTKSSSFLLSANKTLKVDGSSNTNQNSFEVNSGTNSFGQGTFTVGAYGDLIVQGRNSNGNFKVLTILGNELFTLDGNGNQSYLRTKAFDIGTSTTTGYKLSLNAGKHEFIRNTIMGANFDLVNSQVKFWEAGMTSRKFIVGGSALIGTEKISLQSSIAIKGIGTSGSSLLSLYDNDTTPNKLWDFLDNGNVDVNQSVDINTSNTFNFKNGTRSIGVTSWNTHTYWGLNNGVKTWSLISANASGAYNQDEFSIGVTGFQPAFRAFEDSVGVGGLSKTNFDTSFSLHAGTNGIKSSGSIVAEDGLGGANKIELDFNNYPKVKITNGTTEYWLIEGDGTGSTFASGELYLYDATNARKLIHFLSDGNIDFPNLPTSAPTKGMWNDGGTLKIA